MKKQFSIMIGFFLLLQGCTDSAVIAHIPEASGICFSQNSKTLFVVEDEGKIYEISTTGAILRQKRLGDYDLEGVACDDSKGRLLLAREGEDSILFVSQKYFSVQKEVKIKKFFQGKRLLKQDKKHGLEAITIVDDFIFLSNQKDPSLLFKVAKISKEKLPILEIFDHGHADISGLAYHDKILYMLSDTENLLIGYDIQKKKVISIVKLPHAAQEGITFDNDGYLYIADDKGRVLKYKSARFGL